MSTPNHTPSAHHEEENYLTNETTIQSWLLTKDHKRIALLYLLSVTLFFTVGGLFASLVRIELMTPAYNKFFTMHGV
jgi:cytochrome c oxidase subunit 1